MTTGGATAPSGGGDDRRLRFYSVATIALAVIAAAAIVTALWSWRELRETLRQPALVTAETGGGPAVEPAEREDRLVLAEAGFGDLPGWEADPVVEARPALARSCAVWENRPADAAAASTSYAGTVSEWAPFCAGLAALPADGAGLRQLVESALRPWAVANHDEGVGLFTGYYEPLLHGSRRRTDVYRFPLYVRPPELVTVDLGRFREDLAGRRIAGRATPEGSLEPFADRTAIETGELARRGLELVWVDDPVDAFFLQIQGSGRVRLDSGEVIRVGYAGHNGHPYRSIGRELVERGELALEEVSMQSIRRWLAAHPDQAEGLLATNASYVFFRELPGEGPLGSLGVALTPGRSVAVDRRFLPLGAPLWLDGVAPAADEGGGERPLRRLMVAQDTGGAIAGPVRGDVFWGFGDEAAAVAGRMKHPGRLWVLLPRGVEVPPELAGER